MALLSAIPCLPVVDIKQAATYYADKLGFEERYVDDDYGVIGREDVEIHLWAANKPGTAGAEPHIAGTASCRIAVSDVQALYEQMKDREVVHLRGQLDDHPWGPEFTVTDRDNNAITFYQPR
jgi:uncharacterized glyoxalase superfamily protein PhnB